MTTGSTTHTAANIAEHIGGTLAAGPADTPITGISDFNEAQPGDITLIGTQRYADRWPSCPATAALVLRDLNCPNVDGKTLIHVDNADLSFSKALTLFAPPPIHTEPGIHPTATVHASATFGKDVSIGAYCTIGPGVVLGDRCTLYNNVTILDHSQLGDDCTVWSGVVIRDRCTIGHRFTVHPNSVIGADGFGYRPETTEQGTYLVKTPQIGTVIIGNDVEVGANSCIDRAKCNATVISDGCKIDNLVQIGHNCRLGRMVVVSGCTGIGGSTVIGDGTMIGGHVAITDHATIGPGVQIAGGTQVASDLKAGGTYAGSPARLFRDTVRENAALRKLPALLKQQRRR